MSHRTPDRRTVPSVARRRWIAMGVALAVGLCAARAQAQATTGFLQTGAGPWLYTTATNWVGGTVNGTWDSSLALTGSQTVQFDADTTLTTNLTFNQAGVFGLSLTSTSATARTVTLGGDVSVGGTSAQSATVTLGNATNTLNVNLGGVTRTMTVSPFRTLTLLNVVSNGGLTKSGSGTLALSGANTFTGGVTLNGGILSLGNAAALGTSSGTLTISGGSLDSSSSNLVLSSNNPQNWNGDFRFIGSQNLNLGTGTVTLGASRTVTASRNTLTVGGPINGVGFGLTKRAEGTLTLNAASKSTFDGGLTITSGTVRLDFANASAPASGLIADTNTLTLQGGALTLVAKSNVASAQTLGDVTINSGQATVNVSGNGTGGMTLTTGTWTRNAGGAISVLLSSGTLVASPTLTNEIIGTWASIGSTTSTRYATVSGGLISSYTGVSAAANSNLTDTSGTMNYELAAASPTSAPANPMSANTIRYAGGSGTTAIGAGSFTVNGLMHVGTGVWTVGTGTLTIGGSRELVVNAANNQVTISSRVLDNGGGASSIVKTGGNTLLLSASNSYTGGTVVNSGNLYLDNNWALGSGTLTINGGQMNFLTNSGSFAGNNPIVMNNDWASANTTKNMDMGRGNVTIARPLTITVANGLTIGGTITGPGSLNAFDLTFQSSGGTGFTPTLSAPIALRGNQLVAPMSPSSGGGSGITYSGVISDGGNGYGLTFGGSYNTSVNLTAANTFTGPLVVNYGTVQLGNNTATGALTSTTPVVTNANFSLYRTTALAQGTDFGKITGSGTVTVAGGIAVLNDANTHSGGTTVSGGTLRLAADSSGSVGAVTSGPLGTGTLAMNGGTLSSDGTTARTIINPIAFGGNVTLGDATNNGTLTFSAPAPLGAAVRTLTVSSTVSFTNTITGTGGGITKAGAGTLLLAGTNTFTNGVTVNAGILNIAADSALGQSTGAVFYTSAGLVGGQLTLGSGTLQFAAGSSVTLSNGRLMVLSASSNGRIDTSLAAGAIDSLITGANGIPGGPSGNLTKVGANALTLNAENVFTGTTTISGGSIKMGVARALQFSVLDTTGGNSGSGVGLDLNGVTSLRLGGLAGSVNLADAVIGSSGLTEVILNPISGTATYAGVIADGSGPRSFTKNGGGTQVLSGAHSYTGATTVNAGLLQVTGSLAAGSAVTVNGGAIGGSGNTTTTGVIGGSLTLSGSGGIDLRNAASGTLTIGGNLAINGAAGKNLMIFDLGTGANGTDKLIVRGTTAMSTSGAAVVSVNPVTIATRINAGTYTLIEGTGSVPAASDFQLPTTKAFGLGLGLSVSGNNLQLTTTQLASGSAAPQWTGGANTAWNNSGNWSVSSAPSYQSNVTMYSSATNLSTTLGEDFNINSLSFPATATSAVTIGGANMLTIEATNANGNTAGTGVTVSSGSVAHTISANVGLAANNLWTIANTGTLTLTGTLTDFGLGRTLTKEGAGRLNLNGVVDIGSLAVGYGNTKTGGSLVMGGSSSLLIGRGPTDNVYVGSGLGSAGSSTGFVDASAADRVTVNVGNFKVGGTVGSTGTFALGKYNEITAATQFAVCNGDWGFPNGYGTVTTAASSTTTITTPVMHVGYNLPNGTTGGWGRFATGAGGSVTLRGMAGGRAQLNVGVTGGWNNTSESVPSNLDLAADGTAVADLSVMTLIIGQAQGGSTTVSGIMTLGSSSANRLDVAAPGIAVLIGDNNGSSSVGGTLTIGNAGNSSSVTSIGNNTAILLASKRGSGGVTGGLNLGSGTLTITTTGTAIGGGGGTSTLSMIGATLKAGASSNTFITGLTNARMYAGGLTLDTDDKSVAIPQSLVAAPTSSTSTNYGLGMMTLLTPTAGGSGYVTPPTVTFTAPSGGTAPTGVAQINAAGQVTGILITNPGSGYTSGGAVTVALSGGTTSTGATAATFANPTATVFQTNGGLTKLGSGTLTLTGTNTYTGTTSLSAGTLVAGGTSALGAASAGISVTGGALDLGGFAFTRTGAVSMTGGTIRSGTLTNNTTAFLVEAGTVSAVLAGSGGLTKSTSGTLALTANNAITGVTTINAGTILAGDGGTTGSLGQGSLVTGSAGGWLVFNRANTVAQGTDFAIEIAGGVGVTQLGSGTLTLSGGVLVPNSYTGGTRISNGTLQLTGNKGLPGKSAVTLGTGSTSGILDLNTYSATLGTVTFEGTGSQVLSAVPGGMLNLEVTSGSAAILVNGGSHAIGSDASLVSDTVINTAAGSFLSLGGAIGGAGTLAKLGSGTAAMYGSNTYAGATTVQAGLLAVNGPLSGTPLVSVLGGAVLGGYGRITGNVGGDGLIAPGNSPGILTIDGQVVPTDLTAFAFEFTATGAPTWSSGTASVNDVLRLTNVSPFTTSLDVDNVVSVYFDVSSLTAGNTFQGGFYSDQTAASADLTPQVGSAAYQYFVRGDGLGSVAYNGVNYYTLAQYMLAFPDIGGVTASVVTVLSANFAGGPAVTDGQVTQFVVAAVPEPGTLALAAAGLAGLGLAARRRRCHRTR